VLGGLCAVAVLVILAIVLSVVLINKNDDPENDDVREKLELIDILHGTLQPKRFNGTWIDDNSFHYFDTNVS
jgi:hypothetical protein